MKNKRAFTLIEIMVVVAIIGLIAAIGAPIFSNAIKSSQKRVERINCAKVDAAKEQWALENDKSDGDTVEFTNIEIYMGTGITNQGCLKVENDRPITLNKIGTPASY